MATISRAPYPSAWAPSQVASQASASAGLRVFRIALALFIAVAVARIQDVVPGLAYFRPGKLLALPLLVALAVALPRWQLLSALRTTTAKCVVVIAVLSMLSIPLSIWPANSAQTFVNLMIPSLVLFVVTSAGFADRKTATVCILTLVVAVGADALYLLVGPAPLKAVRPYIGAGLDPNDSAALFVATLPFAAMVASGRGRKRWLGLAMALLLVAALVKTGSRGGVVGLLVVALTMILRAKPQRRWRYFLVVASGAVVFTLATNETLTARFRTLLEPTSDYNFTEREGRIQIWARGMRYMLTHPVLGVGLSNFETAEGVLSGKTRRRFGGIPYTASHNAFVQIGAELGVIGLAAFVLALWSAGRSCRRIHRAATRDPTAPPQIADQEAGLAAAAYCALLGLVTTVFFLSLAYHAVTLFALAVCVGVQAGSPYATRSPQRTVQRERIRSDTRDERAILRVAGPAAR